MVTDRDITVRAVARGLAPDRCKVREVMSSQVKYVYEDELVEDAARNMQQLQLRRLPVLNRDKRLVGIISLGDLAAKKPGPAGEALRGIARERTPLPSQSSQEMSSTETDRIEKHVRLRAPRALVWRALTDTQEFGQWFGVELSGEVAPGAKLRGPITSTGHEHVTFEATVEMVEPEKRFSFRWHPYAIEPGVDYTSEPMTVVVFTLDEVEGGTLLTFVESGFNMIPTSRRAKAFEMNSKGWSIQMENIKRHLAGRYTHH
jgi:uncharacterized protein YndB with AHSA1/START domain